MALETSVVDITYKRGDSRPIVYTLTDPSTGLPLNLTGYTLPVLAVTTIPAPPDALTKLFDITGTVVVPETGGKISFIPAEDNTGSDQAPNTYFYDAQVVDAGGQKLTFVEGKFKITQDRAKD